MKTYEYHPLARFFPMLPTTEFELLKRSIQQVGLLEPITLYDGKILDGRNRYEACQAIGVEPVVRSLDDGVDPLDLVMAANMRRRHLSEGQKVQIFFDAYGPSESLPSGTRTDLPLEREVPEVTRQSVADITGTSWETVSRIEAVQDDEEIKEKLRAGEIGATAALREHTEKGLREGVYPAPQPTRGNIFARSPAVVEMLDYLGRIINHSARWCESAELGKIDPKGHTPLMIKRVDEAIAALQTFKKKLEEIRDG